MIIIRLYWTALQSIDNNKTLDCPMDTCLSGSYVKKPVGLLAADLNRKECIFEAGTRFSTFLGWIGGKWWHVMLRSCKWNVTWFASRLRPSCFSDLSDGPAGCTHPPTMTFSSASFNTTDPLSIVLKLCTGVFPGRRNLACGAGV